MGGTSQADFKIILQSMDCFCLLEKYIIPLQSTVDTGGLIDFENKTVFVQDNSYHKSVNKVFFFFFSLSH